jgi:peptide/nickel transport system substrate-binding protein
MPVDWKSILGILTALSLSAAPALGAETRTLRAALHSDLKIVDPIWTTALISVHHGYMIYDTLFALDDKLEVRPQMVERHEMSPDKLTWTFVLRGGLEWHDGEPVTAEDCMPRSSTAGNTPSASTRCTSPSTIRRSARPLPMR